MKQFLIRWLVTTLAVAVAVKLTGIRTEGWAPLICMALSLNHQRLHPARPAAQPAIHPRDAGFFILIVNTLTFRSQAAGARILRRWILNAFFGSIIVAS